MSVVEKIAPKIAPKIPIVCFPHAGAGKLYYSKWRFAFKDGIDLRIVQYPLREQRMSTPMPASLLTLAEDIVTEFADSFRGLYAIWGHSMGSVVGYEVAKLCQQRWGNPPMVFFSSGSSAPCDSRFTSVADLDTTEGFNNVLRRYGGVREENLHDADFMKYFAPIIGADLRLLGSYEETTFEQLRCPLVLMEGRDDAVTIDAWARYTEHPLEITEFDGGHFFLDEHRTTMASLMESRIRLQRQRDAASTDRRLPDERLLRELR